jgi:gas vesicle protein
MLKNLIIVGGSAMIMKDIADRVRQVRTDREKALRRKKAGILALGVTIGSTVGAVAGVLFASRTGKETREDLSRRGWKAWGKLREDASRTGRLLITAVEEKSSRVNTAAEKCVDTAKGALRAIKDPAKEDEGTDKKN